MEFLGFLLLEVMIVYAYRHMVSGILVSSLFYLFYLWVRQKVPGRTVPAQHCRQAFCEKKASFSQSLFYPVNTWLSPVLPNKIQVYEETGPVKSATATGP